jgi:hypothetical protein
MHVAIELLIKRMESNPDEFVKGHSRHSKWERIIEKYMEFVNPEDKKIMKEKYSALQLDQMHKDVMAELLYGEENSREEFKNHEQLQMAFQEFRSQQIKETMK